jgi:hypothetical protein
MPAWCTAWCNCLLHLNEGPQGVPSYQRLFGAARTPYLPTKMLSSVVFNFLSLCCEGPRYLQLIFWGVQYEVGCVFCTHGMIQPVIRALEADFQNSALVGKAQVCGTCSSKLDFPSRRTLLQNSSSQVSSLSPDDEVESMAKMATRSTSQALYVIGQYREVLIGALSEGSARNKAALTLVLSSWTKLSRCFGPLRAEYEESRSFYVRDPCRAVPGVQDFAPPVLLWRRD